MQVVIEESRDTAGAHARYVSEAPIGKQGTIIEGAPNLVFWTDASADPQHQSGPSGAALVYQTIGKYGDVVWKDATFGVSGNRNIHDTELLAVVYALSVALNMCMAKKQEAELGELAGSADDSTRDCASRSSQDVGLVCPRTSRVRIISDSQTALRCTTKHKMPALAKLVQALVREIEQCKFLVELQWVPGHSVPGNKLADNLAGKAASRLSARIGHAPEQRKAHI